ncbi:MAG: hypothetical protein R6V45_12955, partial [Oceanipulchritudo sp.]
MYLPRILEILRDPEYIPLSVDRLAARMEVPEKEFTAFKKEVSQHLRQGTLVKLKKNRVCLPRDADLITGKIRFRQSGSATLFPDTVEGSDNRPPYHINAEDTAVAMHGDRVVCRIHQDRRQFRNRRRKQGRPVRDVAVDRKGRFRWRPAGGATEFGGDRRERVGERLWVVGCGRGGR